MQAGESDIPYSWNDLQAVTAISLSPSMLTWLRAFDAAARLRSFTRAAEELRLTQSAVSQQIRQLEVALGIALFLREPTGLRLTVDAEMLHAGTADAFAQIRDTVARVSRPGGAMPVKISCSPGFAMRWLGPRLRTLADQQPRWDIRLHGEYHAIDRGHLGAAKVTIGIRYDPNYMDTPDTLVFLDELLIPVAAPGFDLGGGLGELQPQYLLHDTEPWEGATMNAEWREWFARAGMPIPALERGRRFNLTQLAVGAAMDGAGVALGRLAIVLDDLRAGRLVAVSRLAVRSSARYSLRVPERTARTTAFARWLREEAAAFTTQRDAWLLANGFNRIPEPPQA